MTNPDLSALIPPEAEEAAWKCMGSFFSREEARAVLAAGLAAWPRAWTSESVGNGSLILPLLSEPPNA